MVIPVWSLSTDEMQANHSARSNIWHSKQELMRSARRRALLVSANLPSSSEMLWCVYWRHGWQLTEGHMQLPLQAKSKNTEEWKGWILWREMCWVPAQVMFYSCLCLLLLPFKIDPGTPYVEISPTCCALSELLTIGRLDLKAEK